MTTEPKSHSPHFYWSPPGVKVVRPVRCICTKGGGSHGYYARVDRPKGVHSGFVGSSGDTFEAARDGTLVRLDMIWKEAETTPVQIGPAWQLVELLREYMKGEDR